MSTDQDVDRSEAATPFKLEKAREKGQTARSSDMVTSVAFFAAMAYIAAQGPELAEAFLNLCRASLGRAAVVTDAALWPHLRQLAAASVSLLLPLFAMTLGGAIVGGIAQTGFVLSLEPLQGDFNRLNPATGLKRVLSLRTLFDGFRAGVKLVLLATTAALTLWSLAPEVQSLFGLPPAKLLAVLVDDVAGLGLKMALALLGVAAMDMLFTRHEFARNMRMSRRELKDEFKSREGDPRIRHRLRELRKELLKRARSLRNTGTADLVLTNPTHYAVALRYVRGEMAAPRVVAKGAGQLAAAMRGIAARHHVIVVQNPPLARRLFREAALEADIPASFHAEIAKLYVWVMEMRRQNAVRPGDGQ